MAKKEWSNETLSTLKIGNRVWRAQVVTSPTGAEFLALKAFKPKAAGGEVVSFGSKTTILLVKAGGKASSKVEKAEAKGTKVQTFEELGI